MDKFENETMRGLVQDERDAHYERDREREMNAESHHEVERKTNPFTHALTMAALELDIAYSHLVFFPDTQERIKILQMELIDIIQCKTL